MACDTVADPTPLMGSMCLNYPNMGSTHCHFLPHSTPPWNGEEMGPGELGPRRGRISGAGVHYILTFSWAQSVGTDQCGLEPAVSLAQV